MESLAVTPNLTMLRINGWQVYAWRDGDSVTLIDTGAPGSGAEIAAALPGIDRIVLTHGHVDHAGSAAEMSESTGASVMAGVRDAAAIRGETVVPPPVFEDWEVPIHERVSVGMPDVAPPVRVDRELHDGDVLSTGDTIANVGALMLGVFNQDRAHRRVVPAFGLDVETACFGHGEPIISAAGDRIREVAATLTQ